MLPVVAPAPVVARKIVLYSYVMVAATLALAPYAGWIYAAGAAGLGAWFLAEAHRLRSRVARLTAGTAAAAAPAAGTAAGVAEGTCGGLARPEANPAPMHLFHASIAYLSVLFLLVAVTAVLPWGRW
jgi:protoheme IX farnesyltransferase